MTERKFSQDMADEICLRLSNGISLNDICSDPDMPSKMSVWRWQRAFPEFAEQMQEARANMAEFLAGEIVKIADSEEDPNRAKVRIAARQWVCAKLLPQRFGDRVELNGTLSVERAYSDAERAAAMLLILREGQVNLPALIEGVAE
jgi:hypothetical protein